MNSNLKIDLGCGSCKKEGTIGIDFQSQPGVDYVLDLQVEPLPFPDKSVEYVYSAHFLEHIEEHFNLLTEISRVCKDGAELEFWTPYCWSNPAFIFSHKSYFTEDHYLHLCVWFADYWEKLLNSRWILKEFVYIVEPDVLTELYHNGISLDFALRYYKGVVKEFGTFIEVHHGYDGATCEPKRMFALDRSSQRYPVNHAPKEVVSSDTVKNAIEWFSSAQQQQSQPPIRKTQTGIEQFQSQLQQTQVELQQARATIAAMQTSKFWKLRTAWFNFKRGMGIATNE